MSNTKHLTVYIEGDGFAWQTTSTPSANPTPINPIGLKLALAHPENRGAAVYLARPCQYVSGVQWKSCAQVDWTGGRFSRRVVDATDNAVEQLKERFGAEKITLVGYSGGGAVAALVAAQRHDIDELVTVAGNLDTDFWVKRNRFKPLAQSLNPADFSQKLVSLEQVHFVGAKDKTVQPEVAYAYAQRFPVAQKPRIELVHDADHICCWAQQWPILFK